MKKLWVSLPVVAIAVFSCFKGGVLNKDLVFKTKNGPVVFSHVYHVKVKKQQKNTDKVQTYTVKH